MAVEGAAVSVTALASFRAAVSRAVWSRKLPMTNTPALLSLLDAPWGSDPAFIIIWNRFRQLRRYLAYRPDDQHRIFRLLDYASAGAPGHGPIHLLVQSADELGFFWDSDQAGWIRPGLPPLRMMTVPIQHFRDAIWQAWQHKVATDLCKRKGFRGGFGFDIYGSHQLLVSSHLRERDKMLLRAILSGGVWNGFLLSKVKKEEVPCRFCGAPDNDGHLFWDCTFPPFVELRNQPEFLPLMSEDRTHWPRCLLWHGWLPGLSPRTLGTPWAVASSDLASSCLENALGSYPVSASSAWQPFWDQDDVEDMVDDVPDYPNILTLILMLRLLELVLLFILLPLFLIVIIGVMLRILMILMKVALISFRVSLALFSRFSEPSIGASFLPCRLILAFTLVLII